MFHGDTLILGMFSNIGAYRIISFNTLSPPLTEIWSINSQYAGSVHTLAWKTPGVDFFAGGYFTDTVPNYYASTSYYQASANNLATAYHYGYG